MMTTRTLTNSFDPTRIRAARHLVGLSPKAFAESIGKSDQTVRNWERGVTSPTIRDLEALCECYGFDLSYFVRGKKAAQKFSAVRS